MVKVAEMVTVMCSKKRTSRLSPSLSWKTQMAKVFSKKTLTQQPIISSSDKIGQSVFENSFLKIHKMNMGFTLVQNDQFEQKF